MRNMKVIALVAMIGLMSSVAFGGLVVDMRNVSQTGAALIDPATHTITLTPANVGDIITFQVWATVTGGTTASNLIQAETYIKETNTVQGQVKGNMAGVDGGAISLGMYTSNFQGGSIPVVSTNALSGDTEFGTSASPYNARNASGMDAASGIQLGTFSYVVTSLVGASNTPTVISLVPRTTNTAGANYYVDTTNYKGNARDAQLNYLYTSAASGGSWSLTTVPEPSVLILLGMGVLGLLAIRRRK